MCENFFFFLSSFLKIESNLCKKEEKGKNWVTILDLRCLGDFSNLRGKRGLAKKEDRLWYAVPHIFTITLLFSQSTIIKENTSPLPPEEESEGSQSDEEEIDSTAESIEANEDTPDSEDLKYESFSSEGEETTVKPSKPVKPANQFFGETTNKPSTQRPTKPKPTSKKPTRRKTTAKVKPTSATDMQNTTTQNNSTDSGNNTGYPYFPGYYGGNPQNIHDLFLTSTGTPFTHESYNEIPHYSDDWSNRVAIDHNPFDGFSNPYYEFRSPIVNEPTLVDDIHYFRRFPVMEVTSPPEFINSGFRPSFQYSRST